MISILYSNDQKLGVLCSDISPACKPFLLIHEKFSCSQKLKASPQKLKTSPQN